MRRGLYRIHGASDRPDDVRVDDDGIELPMEEWLYRARGHLPAVDDLPWQEDYSSAPTEATDKAARERARQEFVERVRKSQAR